MSRISAEVAQEKQKTFRGQEDGRGQQSQRVARAELQFFSKFCGSHSPGSPAGRHLLHHVWLTSAVKFTCADSVQN